MSEEATWTLGLSPETHPGLTEEKAATLCTSARVCLYRHHRPPTGIEVHVDDVVSKHVTTWAAPTAREKRVNGNALDAACDGAYAIALMCLERKLALVAVGRAEHRSGADWYIAPPGRGLDEAGAPNPDDPMVLRLEVGGHDDRPSLPYELKCKVEQLRLGSSAVPGIAAIVGFKKARVLIEGAPRGSR
jgi:hypothetical protein